ncbi:MAG: HIT family protein [Actinomycetota bacterium]|nr:HIT family protein [Actinomycetota bacterium]
METITLERAGSARLWIEEVERWHTRCRPEGCPVCLDGPAQPDERILAETPECWVVAGRHAPLPGYACVTSKHHAVEPFELAEPQQAAFFLTSMRVAKALASVLHPIKMNYEIHGNTIPHLHMHLYPRTTDDPYVGYPIHGTHTVRRRNEDLDRLGRAVESELRASNGPCGTLLP